MLLASWGWRVVVVALSLKEPYGVSKQYVLIAVFKAAARLSQVLDRLVLSDAQVAREEPVMRVR
jgi:plasmid replication initiation protein